MPGTDGPDLINSEVDVLLRYLDKMRNAVIASSNSLSEEEVRRAWVPSGTSLLGILHHLIGVEKHWFQMVFLGEDVVCDLSMDVPVGLSCSAVVLRYRQACARSNKIVRSCPDLSTVSAIPNPGEARLDSLRLIVAHMIEETARHAGQADILREMTDTKTSDLLADEAWDVYREPRDRFIELLGSISDDEANVVVPMCPEWTVAGVVSHVCGLNADIASGLRVGLGSDENTALQVAQRAGQSVGEICAEWVGHETAVRLVFETDPLFARRLAGDLVVHLHDVQHALGLEIVRDDEATVDAAHLYVQNLQERVQSRLGIGIVVELSDGNSDADLVLRAEPYDFLRSVTSRRSRRQVESLDWTGDPTRVLDEAWTSYGPLREHDVDV